MALTSGRVKVKILRGTFSAIQSNASNISDGELIYATDQDRLYIIEGSTLTALDYTIESEITEKIQDTVAAALTAGTGIDITYNDVNGTIEIEYVGGAGTGGITQLSQASDVDVTGKVDKSLLVYDSSSSKFVANNVNTVITLTDGGNF